MSAPQAKPFNLPWNQHEQYWVHVDAQNTEASTAMIRALKPVGMQLTGNFMAIRTNRQWKPTWDAVYAELVKNTLLNAVKVAVTPGNIQPSLQTMDWRNPAAMQRIAESVWLGEALLDDRILCYLQPVVSSRDKIFGYESFARAQAEDGSIISGDKIILASRALGIEYMIDRHLHVQAIATFVCSDFDGFLFVNLFPGFIQRPAVYLEGLSDAAKTFGMVSKHVVLDFTRSESPRDIAHIKSISEYGRSRGYSIALDDIESLDSVKKLVPDIKPDFVKIERKLAGDVAKPARRETITRIVEFVHANGGTIIAEGVETEAMYTGLKAVGVDLFQGYFFSPPVPVEALVNRNAGTG
jgi:EAL domain-containing protein (putative c-di-GMP-specific phosphodiesterase class I)